MGDPITIIVKHLPRSLSSQHICELLKAFGASEIKTKHLGRQQKPVAFATFIDKAVADATVHRLHQLEVSGSRLCVEFVTSSNAPNFIGAKTIENELGNESGGLSGNPPGKRPKLTENRPNLNAISRSLGLDYPLNPKIKYFYPPPNHTVLTNIMNCLVTVPKFYNQVLHLMNKMNLPSPFETVSMDIAMGINMATSQNNRMAFEANKSSEESELESDEESTGVVATTEYACKKLPRKTKKLLARRSLKPVSSEATSVGNLQPSEVFDLHDPLVSKRIEFNFTPGYVRDPAVQQPKEHVTEEPMEQIPAVAPAEETESEAVSMPTISTEPRFITDEQLRSCRITKEGMDLLPVYKKYQPGPATSRLYLKNLAKQVEEDDLRFIYGRYNKEPEALDIRLMKEGRMKGQAFVTFKEDAWAVDALNATNGYVLHGKPIVVQFARSTKPKEM